MANWRCCHPSRKRICLRVASKIASANCVPAWSTRKNRSGAGLSKNSNMPFRSTYEGWAMQRQLQPSRGNWKHGRIVAIVSLL